MLVDSPSVILSARLLPFELTPPGKSLPKLNSKTTLRRGVSQELRYYPELFGSPTIADWKPPHYNQIQIRCYARQVGGICC